MITPNQTPIISQVDSHLDMSNIPVSQSTVNMIIKENFWKEEQKFILYSIISTFVIIICLFGIIYYKNCELNGGLFSVLNFLLGSIVGLLGARVKMKRNN